MTAMTVRLGCPLLLSLSLEVCEDWRFCPSGDSDDSGDGNVGISCHCHPAGEHPVNAKCRRGISSPFPRLVNPPLRQKNPLIFPTAFTGCNTLHLAGKERVPDVPSGLPYGGRALPCVSAAPRFGYKNGAGDGDSAEGYPKTAVITVTAVTQRMITRRKKGGIPPCHMQSCVSRNARQAA